MASASTANRGAILPDARAWQRDAGLEYLVTSGVKFIAGVFEIGKPYFNLDTSNVDRELGRQRASGLEWPLSGEVYRNLNVTAAMLRGEMKVLGPNLGAEGIGPFALNQPDVIWAVSADYTLPELPAISADISASRFGWYSGSVTGWYEAHRNRWLPWVLAMDSECWEL